VSETCYYTHTHTHTHKQTNTLTHHTHTQTNTHTHTQTNTHTPHTQTNTHTHTHIIVPPHFSKNVPLPNTRSSHSTFWLQYRHRPRQSKLFWVLFVSSDLRHRIHYIIHEDESRISIWNFLAPVKEIINRPGPLWRISSSSMAFEENELLDAWPLDAPRSGCSCDTPRSTSKPPSSSQLLSLGAPASQFSLSQTSSDIGFSNVFRTVEYQPEDC